MIVEISYMVYLVVSVAMTIWVARTLSKNGRVFLIDSFNDNEALADSVNHMLVVGFYLINLGYILLALKTQQDLESLRVSIEFLSKKIGLVLLILGIMHLFNVFVIAKWRARALSQQQQKHTQEQSFVDVKS